ncbi:MAG: prepilin-type N-terminal cleavage/methylation domain-containing protein [Nitrospira sp.]|nr:prepilin-type N-terminal cleavage/methylation domain-containing protein [Nitrospira sp.]
MKPESGFTLIEIMVTVAIVGVMMSIAIPNYLQWQIRNNLHQTTAEVATQLTRARMVAMNRNRSVDVTIEDETTGAPLNMRRVKVTGVLSSTAALPTPTVVLSKTIDYFGTTVAGGAVTMTFSSMGQRTSGGTGGQNVGICNLDKLQYTVKVLPMGKVDWEPKQEPGATPCPL